MHGTGGDGTQFLRDIFAGELFGPASRWMRRNISSSSSTTSVTANRASRATACTRSFRTTRYADMILAEHAVIAEKAERRSFASGDGHVDGRHAHLAVGRNVSGLHGRADAAGIAAGADLRPQPDDAQDDDRCDPHRSRVEKRRLHSTAARNGRRVEHSADHGIQSVAMAEGSADARRRRYNSSTTASRAT